MTTFMTTKLVKNAICDWLQLQNIIYIKNIFLYIIK